MEIGAIKNIVARANLALSPDIVNKIYQFLEKHIGSISENLNYHVFAALAIVSEVRELRPVDSGAMVGCGISLETVLRHLGGLSKESLLEVVTRQYMKWREAPAWLGLKIDSVKLAYRIYKKYRAVFEAITGQHCLMETQRKFNLMAIFWVVFLFIKNDSKEQKDAIEATTILYSLFKFTFGELVTQLTQTQIAAFFRQQFSECEPPSEKDYQNDRESILFHLNGPHIRRFKNGELSLKALTTDDDFMTRFLDDIANNYDRFKVNLPKHSVDQISFLELDKTLTPQSIRRDYIVPQATSICKRMNFNDDDEEDQGNPPNDPIEAETVPVPEENNKPRRYSFNPKVEPLSPFRRLDKFDFNDMTPLSARHQNLAWVNKITARPFEKDVEVIQQIYGAYTQQPYQQFQERAMRNILQSIKEFSPSCIDYAKRQKSIFSFFAEFIKKIYHKHNEDERKKIFDKLTSYDSILSLSANLFNFAYQSLQSSYRQYCQIFGVGIVEGMLPINWFGCNIKMPKNIEGYLYDLEKKILIQEIWEDHEGYDLLSRTNQYQGQAILKRLRKHADERTRELCESMRIEDKQITKVINLVRFILEKRQGLLKDHKMDQIVVCSIASIMSINRSRNFSLQEIFQHYNRLLHTLNISKSTFYGSEGQQIDLLDYYNHIFLQQVDDILSNEEQANKVLDTPVREQRRRIIDQGKEMTPFSKKFQQLPIGTKKIKREEDQERPIPLRNQIVASLKGLSIKQQDEEQEMDQMPSPSFKRRKDSNDSKEELGHGLFRTFSFGDFGEKF